MWVSHRTSYSKRNSTVYPRQSRITFHTLLWDTLYYAPSSALEAIQFTKITLFFPFPLNHFFSNRLAKNLQNHQVWILEFKWLIIACVQLFFFQTAWANTDICFCNNNLDRIHSNTSIIWSATLTALFTTTSLLR